MQLLNCLFIVLLGTVHGLEDAFGEQWENFKTTYNKQYKSQSEEALRIQIFQNNLKEIEAHNRLHQQGHVTYTMGINQFADLTNEEFLDLTSLKIGETESQSSNYLPYEPPEKIFLPNTVDWRKKGAVTNVKYQGMCGSCWSFSVTGALEAQYFLKEGKLVSLSEQYLVDCSTGYDNFGCRGGVIGRTFDFVKDNGIYSENDYPYIAKDGVCRNVDKPKVLKVSNHYGIKPGSEHELQVAVALKGPISIALDCNPWQFYNGGIFYNASCSTLKANHAVLVVGYGSDTDDYWLIKNSWGADWGEKGYIRLRRNKNNQCGVANFAHYPNVVKF